MPTLRLPVLPTPSDRRLAVRVSRDAERQLRAGHPWVFDRSIRSVSGNGEPGDLAVVFDADRRFLAIGLWDPASPIRIRVLHAGSPALIDDAWWHGVIARAVRQRDPLASSGHTTAYRLVHGENDGLGGLVVDRYDCSVVVKVYSAAWLAHLRPVLEAVVDVVPCERVVLRLARQLDRAAGVAVADGDVVAGPAPTGPVEFMENGLTFGADLHRGHKTGHFIDQRDHRRRVASRADGGSVLDAFSCTGGFGVHAAAAGATSVLLVDRSGPAIAEARANFARNQDRPEVAACTVEAVVGDAFEVLGGLATGRRRFDVVVVDPPAFASRKADVGPARAAHTTLARLAVSLCEPGGWYFHASCSTQLGWADLVTAIRTGARQSGREVGDLTPLPPPLDHPVGFVQGHYLDAALTQVR